MAKRNLYNELTSAAHRVRETLRDGDEAKWSAYNALSAKGKLEWRKANGHAEFCRLQRLDYHRFIG